MKQSNSNKTRRSRMQSERGVALFLALILISTLSVLTVSMMFLAQSESFASTNYRLMTQSRYGAEAGVQKAADYILNTDFSGPLGGLIPTVQSPVQFGGNDVTLSSDPDHPSHFPDAPTVAAFQAATNGTIVAGNSTINYTAFATLLSVDKITDGYTGVAKLVQTWQITSTAAVAGINKSAVEVTAILDSDKVPTIAYGAFSTNPGCASLSFQGNVSTNSYDSSTVTGNTAPTEYNTGGDVGTNGNLTIQGHVDVNGNLLSPIIGVGNCTNNGGVASTALTQTGAATVAGGAPLRLPQTMQMPIPPIPPPSPIAGPVSIGGASTCANLGLNASQCVVSGNTVTLINTTSTPLSLPSINIGNATLVLTASNNPTITNAYNFNSITLQNTNSSLLVESPSKSNDVKVNLTGLNPDGSQIANVIDMQGGSTMGGFTTTPNNPANTCGGCSQYDASLLQFIYGGPGNVNVSGNPSGACVFYAPNAAATFSGTSNLNGALIANTLAINGGGNTININYDWSLAGKGQTASVPMLASFSWKKY